MDMESSLPGGTLRNAVKTMAAGGLTENPFPEEGLEELRAEIRKILKWHDLDEGFKRRGDAEQLTDVRLLQALMIAFEDPDFYFAEWWARGVWLGSPDRPLPRAPALYERKTKWNVKQESEASSSSTTPRLPRASWARPAWVRRWSDSAPL